MKKIHIYTFKMSLLTLAMLTAQSQASSEYGDLFLGGPGSVSSQIAEDEKAKQYGEPLLPDLGFKERLKKEWGLTFGFDYNALFQYSDQSDLENSKAGGGVARFYGRWQPFGSESSSGALVFKVENRHALSTDIAPQSLGAQFGYAGLTAVTFSDAKGIFSNFYWNQSLMDNRLGFNIGIVDAVDYLDVYGLANIWTEFNNLSFTTNPTIPTPKQGLGAAARWLFTPNLYVLSGIADANGDPAKTEDSFESFFRDSEYFKHIEFGWIGSWDKRTSDNMHITLWQIDERTKANIDDGWGVALSISSTIDDRWLPFFRAGYSEGGGAIVDRAISSGVGYKVNERNDYIGVALGWAKVTSDTEERDQYTMEAYYRVQLLPKLQIVPSIQHIRNPVYNSDIDTVWIGSLRVRTVF